jgi:hypothetical protein
MTYRIYSRALTRGDVSALTAIPEPSTYGILAAFTALLAGAYQRKKRGQPVARANDPICHVPCSEPHGPRQLGSRLIYNVRHIKP